MPQMSDFFLAQVGDFFMEGVCVDTSMEGERGTVVWRPPFSRKDGPLWPMRHGNGARRRARGGVHPYSVASMQTPKRERSRPKSARVRARETTLLASYDRPRKSAQVHVCTPECAHIGMIGMCTPNGCQIP